MAGPILACGCGGVPGQTFAEALTASVNQASAVFSGKVVRFEYRKGNTGDGKMHGKVKVAVLEVERIWKGKIEDLISIYTDEAIRGDGSMENSSCNYTFLEGKEYLVFATSVGRYLHTSNCSSTTTMDRATAALAFLGEGTTPK